MLIIILVLALDQISKLWAYNFIPGHEQELFVVNHFFNLVLVENRGISFGLFKNSVYSNYTFLFLALVVTVILLRLMLRTQKLLLSISYSLIIGGAIGNIIDRLYNGAVIDFIELHVGPYYWPAFNIADSAVCIGGFLLVYDMIICEIREKKKI